MRMIIGLILFWISIFGYLFFIKKKTRLPYEFILPLVFTMIAIIIFISGILNMMLEFSLITCFSGIILFLYYLLKKEYKIKLMFNFNFMLLFFVFLLITILCRNMHLIHYDNFSHWGLIVKSMFINNKLPNFESIIEFKDYQPGSACFIYYFSLLTGKCEGSMIIAQNYLLIAYFFSLLFFSKGKKYINYLFRIMLIVGYLFILFNNIKFYDLLVDTLLAVISIFSIVIFYYFRNDLKKAFLYSLPLSIYLFLVKNTGIILVGYNSLILIYLGIKNKNIKKGIIYAFLSGIISVLVFYIWSKHVSYVYSSGSLASKHALSPYNILGMIKGKGTDGILKFVDIYFKHFCDVFNNLPNLYMIGINIIFVVFIIIYKKYRKKIINYLIVIDVFYILYYIILGIMYIMSMPWEEAKILAGFNRYMFTIVFIIIGILFICIMDILKRDKKNYKFSCIIVSIIVVIGLCLNQGFKHMKFFIGNHEYDNSVIQKFDDILETDMNYAIYNDSYYYIYAPSIASTQSSFLYYLSKYKLNSWRVIIVKDFKDFKEEYENYDKRIIIIEKDDDIIKYIKKNNYSKISNNYYMLNK